MINHEDEDDQQSSEELYELIRIELTLTVIDLDRIGAGRTVW